MSDMLSRAETAMGRIQKASASQTVTYQRLGQFVILQATVGASAMSMYDQNGTVIAFDSTDFLVHAADLLLNGKQVEPRRGDEVIWNGNIYRVLSESQGERPYRDSGPDGTVLRIMTKRVR